MCLRPERQRKSDAQSLIEKKKKYIFDRKDNMQLANSYSKQRVEVQIFFPFFRSLWLLCSKQKIQFNFVHNLSLTSQVFDISENNSLI